MGEAEDREQAVELAQRTLPDVVVMDISMPRLVGTQAIQRISRLRLPTHVVILPMYAEETLVRQALRFGAQAYMLKWAVADDHGLCGVDPYSFESTTKKGMSCGPASSAGEGRSGLLAHNPAKKC